MSAACGEVLRATTADRLTGKRSPTSLMTRSPGAAVEVHLAPASIRSSLHHPAPIFHAMARLLNSTALILALLLTALALPLAAIEHVATPDLNVPPLDDGNANLDAVLKRIVRPDGIDYAALVADHADLDRYRAQLAACSMPMDAKQKKALTLNAYHAWTLSTIATLLPSDHRAWPLWRIYDQGTAVYSLWRRYDFELAHQRFMLDDLDKDFIASFKDARLRCALWRGAWGGPALCNHPYNAAHLDEMLDAATAAFISDPDHVWISTDTKHVSVPAFFQVDQDEFTPVGGIPQFLAIHGPHPLGVALGTGAALVFAPINWRLDVSPTSGSATSAAPAAAGK